MIRFTAFAPDLDPTQPGIITDCANLIPTLKGYKGGPSGADVGMSALAAAALTASVITKLDGTNRLFVGTTTKLYEKSGTSWTDVSRVAAYNASTTYPWRYAQLGNTSLAINKGDVLQSIAAGTDFADVAAPKAACMCVASSFVMLGNTNDASLSITGGPNADDLDRWWCSAINDETDWEPNAAITQCATGRLVDTPGAIKAMKQFGHEILAYKDDSMYLGRWAGPPTVWDWILIPGQIGCSSSEAVADIGTAHIFIGQDDIYRFDGSFPVSLGAPLRKWFFADLDPAYRYKIRSTHDRANAIVYFHYPRIGSVGAIDGCIAYNYKADKWGVAHRTIEATVEYVTGGYTYDTLPITTWDDWPEVAYDSPFWTNSAKYPAYFGTDHKIYSLTGASETSSLTTGDYGTENQYSLLSRVTLGYLVRPTTALMTNYYQEIHGGDWTTDAATGESSGRFDLFRSAPWHKVNFYWNGDVHVTGASAEIQADGVL